MTVQYIKELFVNWTKRKIRHHIYNDEKEIYFREKEIWWVALGKNIGYEVDGKNELFERPVIIIKKYSGGMCFVLPISTQIKNPKPWYHFILFIEGEKRAVNITQGRTISSRRLLRKKGILDNVQFTKLVDVFLRQFGNDLK
ncbi:MAG: type II toxin-antitoxin system PemK/MazF family toxin [Candidatus Magasanikbacteria bacterium]|nr:type II toxin-antitoxin system PemK/MazF family toxin [Candidatus Magasanikbacteria bacterium]